MTYIDTHHHTASTLDRYLAEVRTRELLSPEQEVELSLLLEQHRLDLCHQLARVPWDRLARCAGWPGRWLEPDDDPRPAETLRGDPAGRTDPVPPDPLATLIDDIGTVDRLRRRRTARQRRRRAPAGLARPLPRPNVDDADQELRAKLDGVMGQERGLQRLLHRLDRAVRWARHELRTTPTEQRPAKQAALRRGLGRSVEGLARTRRAAARHHRDAQRLKRRMVEANLRLVVYHAKRCCFAGVPLGDVIQEGNVGLMRAVDKFDPRLGFRFSTYASWWIRQAITRAVPEHARSIRLPVHVLELQRRIRRASQSLEQQGARTPTAAEVGASLELSPARVAALCEAAQDALSLDLPLGAETERTLGDTIASPDDERADRRVEQDELATRARQLLESLPPREALVLRLRFGVDARAPHTLQQIGDLLGVTRERARQIEAQALRKLRPSARRQQLLG